MTDSWNSTPFDEQIALELQDFLPARMFDAHAHVYCVQHQPSARQNSIMGAGPETVGIDVWRQHLAQQLGPNRCVNGLFFPDPVIRPECLEDTNHFLLGQLDQNPESRGLLLASPDQSHDSIRHLLRHHQVVGFKVYHTFSHQQPTMESTIESFLPDWVWELAHDRGDLIMLHLVRHQALADPQNQRYLRAKCERFANAKLILAHAGRGFRAQNTIEGVVALQGLENVWFDTSAICESEALLPILDQFGPCKLLWGTDFPISQIRGRCVSLGDGFAWLEGESGIDVVGTVTQVGLESLRAVKTACDRFGCDDGDRRRIFYDNAVELLGIATALPQDQAMYARAHERIPGATQLLSKRPELNAPGQWPAYFREARGCEVWDIDGRHFVDMSTGGIGSCLLGYRDPDVTRAVQRRIALGSMCSLNAPEEVLLADRLCAIHPWAHTARFTRSGGEAMAVAVRIARASTGRSIVAVCGYHGWHDWYLSANLPDTGQLDEHLLKNLEPTGVPAELAGTTVVFGFDEFDRLDAILKKFGDQLAAIVMEPCRYQPPAPGFLEAVKRGARDRGALLIFDEITVGWRLCFGGSHLKLGIDPDIAVFAKALGNGHPIGAVIGTADSMQGAKKSFISSTYWTESVGPVAALATIDKMQSIDVPAHVHTMADQVTEFWRQQAEVHDVPVAVDDNFSGLVRLRFNHENDAVLRTLFTQWMLDHGFLAGTAFYPTLAHNEDIVSRYGAALEDVFARMSSALAAGRLEDHLRGPVASGGLERSPPRKHRSDS